MDFDLSNEIGGSSSSNAASVFLSLIKDIDKTTFSRASAGTVLDFEGIIKTVKTEEARFEGARRECNLANNSDNPVTQSITVIAENEYQITIGAGSAIGSTVVCSDAFTETITGDSVNRIAITSDGTPKVASTANLTLTITGLVSQLMVADVTKQSNKNPGEYVSTGVLSSPYHGANVDGVRYFDYKNGNTVVDNIVTEAKGSALLAETLKGLMFEQQTTNLIFYSEEFDNVIWLKNSCALGESKITAPNGNISGFQLISSPSIGVHRITTDILVTGLTTVSMYAKHAGYLLQIRPRNIGSGAAFANFDLSDGTLGNSGGTGYINSRIDDAGNGWYRCSLTMTDAGSYGFMFLMIENKTDPEFPSFTADGVSGFYLFGVQVEANNFPTSYSKTEATSVTRAVDLCSYPITTEDLAVGTALCEFSSYWVDEDLLANAQMLAFTTNLMVANVDRLLFTQVPGSAVYGGEILGSKTLQKAGVIWDDVSKNTALNGVVATSGVNTGPHEAEDLVHVGNKVDGLKALNGTIKCVSISDEKVSDVRLSSITSLPVVPILAMILTLPILF